MKQRILVVAVIALGINALADLAGVGSATTTPPKLVVKMYHSGVVTLGAGFEAEATADCPAGQSALGGGYHIAGTYLIAPPTAITSEPDLKAPLPSETPNEWTVRVEDPKTGGPGTVDAWVICTT